MTWGMFTVQYARLGDARKAEEYFGGLYLTDDGLVQKPSVLPASWKKLTLKGIDLQPTKSRWL